MTEATTEKSGNACARQEPARTRTITIGPGSRVTAVIDGYGTGDGVVTEVATDGARVRIGPAGGHPGRVEFVAWQNLLVCPG